MKTYYNMIRHYLFGALLLIWVTALSYSVQAQEFLTGMGTNTQIVKEAKQQNILSFKGKSDAQPLILPFFEDFSNYTGYPNEKLFIDRQAYVNTTFPIFPPSIGVVTLDALNEYGKIYPHLNQDAKGADTLTSRYIRLDSLFSADMNREITLADSLYFSFYFQPGGAGVVDGGAGERIGNQPDKKDSLVLEFEYVVVKEDTTYTVWHHIWSTPGFSVNVWTSVNPLEYFKQVLIPITDKNYLRKNFRFRFRNYASLEPQQDIMGWEGNVDQWHIDYIRLNVDRNCNDVFTNDLAFVTPTTSILKNYQSMPWKQFQATDVKSRFENQLTNLTDGVRTSIYKYTITQNDNVVGTYSTGAIDIDPYFTHGIQYKESQATPILSFTPTSLTDTTTFKITHIFQNAAGLDVCIANDTCVFEQKFSDYYAYDDGTAEYGYCIVNQYNVAYLAMNFSTKVPDSLSAVRIWFNHTKNSENESATFTIAVWDDNNGQPSVAPLYTLEGNSPSFSEQFIDFQEYKFDEKVFVQKNFWIGFIQHGNVQLNIGFDQNIDSRAFFKYNTQGKWETSVFKGTPMLRPVFGNVLKTTSKTSEKSTGKIVPNPAIRQIEIMNDGMQITKVEIYNVMGVKIDEQVCRTNVVQMNVAHYVSGIYFVRIYKENNTIETMKLIKK